MICVDGSSHKKGSGERFLLKSSDGLIMEQALTFAFPKTNNQSEYEDCIVGMRLAKELGAKKIKVISDSKLVVFQINGEWQAKDELLQNI